jgi:hypothetical protein
MPLYRAGAKFDKKINWLVKYGKTRGKGEMCMFKFGAYHCQFGEGKSRNDIGNKDKGWHNLPH